MIFRAPILHFGALYYGGSTMKILPDFYFRRITDIPVSFLVQRDIRALILDIDNTLAFDDDPELPGEVAQWLHAVKGAGMTAVLVSNNTVQRAGGFAKKCELPYIAKAGKPTGRSADEAYRLLGAQPTQTASIGDQLFTDVLFGRRAGCRMTIWVERMGEDIPKSIRIKRRLETPFRWLMRRRGYTQP